MASTGATAADTPAVAATAAGSDGLRLPGFFPRVPRQCKDAAAPFFECFSKAAEYELGQDPGVGRAALGACADKLPAYVACAEAHLTARQRELVLAPQVYREQAAGSR